MRLRSTSGASVSPPLAPELRVVHEARGRLRVHLPRWSGVGADRVESKLLGLRGGGGAARAARARRARGAGPPGGGGAGAPPPPPPPPPVVWGGGGGRTRRV